MADPNRRADIIAAARRVFAEKGYERATIKQITQEAGLSSSALLYWYFKNKHELLHATLKSSVPLAGLVDADEALFEQPPEIVLRFVLGQHLAAMDSEEMRSIMRIVVPQLLNDQQMSQQVASFITPVFELVQGYLEHQVSIGRFRPHDSSIAVRSLIAMSVFYMFNALMLPEIAGGLPDREQYLDQSIDTFIRGLSA